MIEDHHVRQYSNTTSPMVLSKSEIVIKRKKLVEAVELLWANLVVGDFEKSRLLREVNAKMDELMSRAITEYYAW